MSCQHKYKNSKSICKSPPLRDGFCTLHNKQKEKETRLKKFNEENNNVVDDKNIIERATSSNQIIDITNNTLNENIINNENIFSDEQKAYIISKFPKKLHEYLNKVNNPLDETQVIISLLKERNIRIVLNHEENMFGIYEWKGYYHATDIENEAGCSRVDHWSRWNIKFKKFYEFENKNLVPQFGGPNEIRPIYNFDTKKVDINANFIDDEGLKTVLIKTTKQSTEIDMFKDWIIKYSTIAKSVISMVIQIKQQYEYEQLKNQLNNNQIKCEKNEITYFYEINDVTPFLNLNVIYFGDTGEVVIMDGITYKIYKIGLSHRSIERDFREHKRTFADYKMVYIKHCDNNIVVELYLKMELKAKNLMYELPKKLSNDGNKKLLNDKKSINDDNKEDEKSVSKNTETFILTERYDINYMIDLINRLVDDYPLNSIKERDDEIKRLKEDHELKMKQEETKQKQIEKETKEEETKQKQIEKEIELAKIQLEIMKIKYNRTQYMMNTVVDATINTTENVADDTVIDNTAIDIDAIIDDAAINTTINAAIDIESDEDAESDEMTDYDSDINDPENMAIVDNSKKNKNPYLKNQKMDPDLLIKTKDVDNIIPYEQKKEKNMTDKYIIKRHYLKRLLKIDLTDDIIKKWYNKEKQLNNLLCAIGKKPFDDSEDPYFMNMNNKINYLNKILNTFGFEGPLDFKTVITSNEELFKKFENTKLTEQNNYLTMMKRFGKQIRCKNFDFELDKYILICNCVLAEFCIHISSKRRKTKGVYYYEYGLTINVKHLEEIINKY